jgi:hypothetical protein
VISAHWRECAAAQLGLLYVECVSVLASTMIATATRRSSGDNAAWRRRSADVPTTRRGSRLDRTTELAEDGRRPTIRQDPAVRHRERALTDQAKHDIGSQGRLSSE